MRYPNVALLLCLLTLSACIARHPVPHSSVSAIANIDPTVIKEASAGDTIFEEGSYDIIEGFEMSSDIDSTMPGAMGLPFGFAIERTILSPVFQTDTHIYYAAPYEDVLASHTLLGSVIVVGDTVGIRIDKKSGKRQWYVDNSNYNNRGGGTYTTIWSRTIKEKDGVTLEPVEVREFHPTRPFIQITFEGVYDDNLLFFYTETSKAFLKEREYHFDLNQTGKSTTVSLKGHMLKVVGLTETGIQYRWL